MNEDKLTEAAKNYAVNTVGEYDEDFPELNLNELDSECQAAFKAGARWHESLPLADRLSESEKEKIRNEYRKAHSEAFADTTCLDRQYARGRYQVLSEIFGKNLFNPTEQ